MVVPTIFALSSGSAPSGVAVIRISGPSAFDIVGRMAGSLNRIRGMNLRTIRDRNNSKIDQGLILTFPGPASFTGEDCVELQIHGGRAIVAAISRELLEQGCIAAEAGEFTRRAFRNGKMDLVEVEGLGDLIAADTEMQRRLAIEQASGGLSLLYQGWANRLTHARAMIEAELDFADEEDVPGSVSDRIWPDITLLHREILKQVTATQSGRLVRDGFNVVIAGPPNAGKSSLINALSGRDVAIVTSLAGTTRDLIEVELDMDGFLVRLVDTAGIRETDDVVEREGVRRARRAVESADLVLDLSEIDSPAEQTSFLTDAKRLRVGTKADLHPLGDTHYDAYISVSLPQTIDHLRSLILQELKQSWEAISSLGVGRLRHISHLQQASIFIEDALKQSDIVLRAESLRLASDELGRITGRVDVEDLLGVIFSEFCIGK
ncbi:tRNA uridine-5-carboxymethylaminomethyl(34) synthesis GTPase MnmE [Rhizobium lemnae]|uniref:tRNA modification GTPase MnmE n=1 Tax=Rhizobium lemnae TaxID=1214924 RepID=A0ABV8E9Y6_9HYPH|nr:tRNA uridine-5-carboxymethylaminomethyl(34) synthesis GTPase MnmE [Rhizobium lemnae]MCJ8508463.1 tRNA uridine-5-carboxymethylaminomethyl(34) synthesis GTPase MnmE [Rhizobium lemnae]